MQTGAIQRAALEGEGGVEQAALGVVVFHVHAEALPRCAEMHAVLQLARQERRDVEGLGHREVLAAAARGRQHVVVALAPGRVADLAEDRRQLAVGVEAVEEAHRVEGQPPAAWLGEQADAPLRGAPQRLADALAHRIAERHALAGELRQVVALAKRQRREAAGSDQRRQAEQGVLLAEVEVQQADAVAERMRPRTHAPVAYPALVQRAVHSRSPNASATRRALTTPSSWKPLAQ
ncbi:hypothetical protein D3C80_902110 [compost metagenome]